MKIEKHGLRRWKFEYHKRRAQLTEDRSMELNAARTNLLLALRPYPLSRTRRALEIQQACPCGARVGGVRLFAAGTASRSLHVLELEFGEKIPAAALCKGCGNLARALFCANSDAGGEPTPRIDVARGPRTGAPSQRPAQREEGGRGAPVRRRGRGGPHSRAALEDEEAGPRGSAEGAGRSSRAEQPGPRRAGRPAPRKPALPRHGRVPSTASPVTAWPARHGRKGGGPDARSTGLDRTRARAAATPR